VQCARTFAHRIGAPSPDGDAVLKVVRKVVDEREAIDAATAGLITKDEAISLLLAHFHSDLFALAHVRDGDDNPWADRQLLDDVKRGLFGTAS
jgi:hypothetical protein